MDATIRPAIEDAIVSLSTRQNENVRPTIDIAYPWKFNKRTENDRAQRGNDGEFWSELSSFFGRRPATTVTLEADAPPNVFGTSRIAE
ncbi:hypothetical protein AtubIFM54640_010138 [Aspergillus tubingensis]|nr:hypothetical protein AtubIFM54640_010138 [Aspergillus tubingensis]